MEIPAVPLNPTTFLALHPTDDDEACLTMWFKVMSVCRHPLISLSSRVGGSAQDVRTDSHAWSSGDSARQRQPPRLGMTIMAGVSCDAHINSQL